MPSHTQTYTHKHTNTRIHTLILTSTHTNTNTNSNTCTLTHIHTHTNSQVYHRRHKFGHNETCWRSTIQIQPYRSAHRSSLFFNSLMLWRVLLQSKSENVGQPTVRCHPILLRLEVCILRYSSFPQRRILRIWRRGEGRYRRSLFRHLLKSDTEPRTPPKMLHDFKKYNIKIWGFCCYSNRKLGGPIMFKFRLCFIHLYQVLGPFRFHSRFWIPGLILGVITWAMRMIL